MSKTKACATVAGRIQARGAALAAALGAFALTCSLSVANATRGGTVRLSPPAKTQVAVVTAVALVALGLWLGLVDSSPVTPAIGAVQPPFDLQSTAHAGRVGFALIRNPDQQIGRYSVGDEVGDGWRVKKVESNLVVLTRDGKTMQLTPNAATAPPLATAASGQAASPPLPGLTPAQRVRTTTTPQAPGSGT
jgi:type II secretory pathway component PulC